MAYYKITTKDKIEVLNAVSYGQAELIFAKHGNPKDIIKIEVDINDIESGGNQTEQRTDKALSLSGVSNLLLDGLWLDRWIAKLESKLKLEHRAQQAIQIERELNILRTIKKKAVTPKSNNY